jgi:hypothetical protein
VGDIFRRPATTAMKRRRFVMTWPDLGEVIDRDELIASLDDIFPATLETVSVAAVPDDQLAQLWAEPYHPSVFHASHRGGKGRQAWRILTMRRMPRVNQEVLPRATFLG